MNNKTTQKSKAVELTDGDKYTLYEAIQKQELHEKIYGICAYYELSHIDIAGVLEEIKIKLLQDSLASNLMDAVMNM